MAKGSKKKKADKATAKSEVKATRKAAEKAAKAERKAAAKAERKADRKTAEAERKTEKKKAAAQDAAASLLARRDAIVDLLRVGPGFRIADFDAAATPGFDGSRTDGESALAGVGAELSDLQERLFAHGRTGGDRSVLLVLQGLDTAGKGGIVRHVLGLVDPQGVALRSFGVPTAEERRHHYLWRVRRALPPAGSIGVFDRSHYEDVLVVRVDGTVAPEVWQKRFDEINRFEAQVAASGTTIIKVALWVSPEEQDERLSERLERPDKHWKYNPSDVDVRSRRAAYEAAYQEVLDRTSTDVAPWHVVPADSKWYARLAVSALLHRALADLRLDWPVPDYDVETEKRRLAATR
ncbi:PPK2 family polyphosphate kinase [Cellulomonas xiejunii]|uniref:Polyphosphate kinase 2 family protein n=1 Tax=Cellulomonas xiejunii TaxID=2968083 RepID=A0ABY5KMB5_9CELL|nr:PPK2 family polyphosphate kinase [Cellulomonas xiejunii]MCC2320587.1 polyphosphate kinase 2 family protein [Cellulomonas xiejunii]UUI70878.1 polyphosphate kinase 2 family protein [Cellulomonas xiejunii]